MMDHSFSNWYLCLALWIAFYECFLSLLSESSKGWWFYFIIFESSASTQYIALNVQANQQMVFIDFSIMSF